MDLIIKNGNIATLRGPKRARVGIEMKDICIIRNGAIGIQNDKIAFVGKSDEIKNGEEVIDAEGKCVIPGYVDCHTHLIFAGTREDEMVMKIKGMSYMEIHKRGGGILRTVEATRKASKEELFALAMERLDRMLLHGTTTVEGKSGYGLNLDDEIKSLEVLKMLDASHYIDVIPTFLGAHAIPPEYFGNSMGYIDFIVSDVLPQVCEKDLATYCDIFCEDGVFNLEETKKLLKAAKNMGMKLKIHADEIVPLGGSSLAAELGAVSAEHLAVTSEDDMRKMANAKVIGVLLPGTPFVLMQSRYPDARKMIEIGMAVAISTDLNPNCYTESMQIINTLGCLQMKMTPEETLTASTINAAYACGVGERVGSIEVGKFADIVIMDCDNHRQIPYHFGVNHVNTVIKRGKIVVEDGRLVR